MWTPGCSGAEVRVGTGRDELVAAVMAAGRESTTAGVLLHAVLAHQLGLNVTDTRALDLLLRLGPQSAGELAAHTGLTNASITALVDRLEQRGLVARERDDADRRRVVVRASPDAPRRLVGGLEPFLRRLGQALEGYSDAELVAIARYLREAAEIARDEATRAGGRS